MANSSPRVVFYALMVCWFVTLDKCPKVQLVGIREIICWLLAKLVLQAEGDSAKVTFGNIQVCTSLEVGIEGEMHTVHQRPKWPVTGTGGEEDLAGASTVVPAMTVAVMGNEEGEEDGEDGEEEVMEEDRGRRKE